MSNTDQFSGVGGSYTVDPRTGERKQVEKPTEDHPEGNQARDENGKPLDQPAETQPALPAPASTPPWATPAPDKATPPAYGRHDDGDRQ